MTKQEKEFWANAKIDSLFITRNNLFWYIHNGLLIWSPTRGIVKTTINDSGIYDSYFFSKKLAEKELRRYKPYPTIEQLSKGQKFKCPETGVHYIILDELRDNFFAVSEQRLARTECDQTKWFNLTLPVETVELNLQ